MRPKGYLEIRFIDAQPGDWWTVPTAVVAALLEDGLTWQLARDACAPVEGRWRDAARLGVGDPELGRAAEKVLTAAVSALRASPDTAVLASQVEGYLDRWTARRRCPADDPPDSATSETGPGNGNGQGDELR